MNDKAFRHLDSTRRDTFEDLKEEYDSVNGDMQRIKMMKTSEESKKQILEELEHQKNEIKERMHNYIDELL